MTVLDTSAVIDFLLGSGTAPEVENLMTDEGELAAPDLIVFEVLAVLRQAAISKELPAKRATAALDDLADLPLELFPSLPLRCRAWELRHNLTAPDALFVALAERLDEPLATKDTALARAASKHTTITTVVLS